MNQICSKIYYLIITGEILVITQEAQGFIANTTKEEDIQSYTQLQSIDENNIDYIGLKYGALESTFCNAKSYRINLDTKKLEVVYYTQDELNTIQQQNQETQALGDRVSDISNYLSNSDETTISNIENSILEIEKNKIINGGM
jgi:hypothetical protein